MAALLVIRQCWLTKHPCHSTTQAAAYPLPPLLSSAWAGILNTLHQMGGGNPAKSIWWRIPEAPAVSHSPCYQGRLAWRNHWVVIST